MGLALLLPLSLKKLPHVKVRAARANCLAPIVAFANKRRRGGGLTAGNGKGRQRVAREAKGGKNSQRSLTLPMANFAPQCHPLPPNATLCLIPANAPRLACCTLPSPPSKYQRLFYKRNPRPLQRCGLSATN